MFTRLSIMLALLGALSTSPSPTHADTASDIKALQATVAAQQVQINTLRGLLSSFSKVTDTTRADKKKGTELYITGMNLHIVNGLGATNGDPSETGKTAVNGLGNVIVGYNASRSDVGDTDTRTGSHNLIVGDYQNYSNFGGVAFGEFSTVGGAYASVTAGYGNTASGSNSSVSGGQQNDAFGQLASISGGLFGTASGTYSSVGGGGSNTASGGQSSVSGGNGNTASGDYSCVSGGKYDISSGTYSSVSGGDHNEAGGAYSSVSGGQYRSATGDYQWVGGGLYQNN